MTQLTIDSLEMVALWHYDVENKICPVCHVDLLEPTQNALKKSIIRNDVSIGDCNHGIHLECASSWLSSNVSCPICMTKWIQTRRVSPSVYVLNTDLDNTNMTNIVANKHTQDDKMLHN